MSIAIRGVVAGATLAAVLSCGEGHQAPSEPEEPAVAWAADLTLPEAALNYAQPALPPYLLAAGIRSQLNTPPTNPVTDWGATLGRVLFYDSRLSANATVSCATCHNQAHGFADPARFSAGFLGGTTGRHSMGLTNAAYYPNGRFFWDERAATLEDQVLIPIQDPVEMGMTLDALTARLSAVSWYPALFERAFGTPVVSAERISLALAQFVRSMVSYQTRFDAGRATLAGPVNLGQAIFPNYTAQEQLGKSLFFDPGRGNCAVCHGTETFTSPRPTNNGLDVLPPDGGVRLSTGNPGDDGKFKVPSLRNVALRPPFMHDGRFATLDAVISHYSNGVRDTPTLAPELRGPGGVPRNPNFSPNERAALRAFLETLTDPVLASDPRWANPFRQ